MSLPAPKIRLFVPQPLSPGAELRLEPPQSHYLLQVMRRREGEIIGVFNGQDGEWLAEIVRQDKKHTVIALKDRRRPQEQSPDLWLAFAPIKGKSELVVEKAAELGASRILPIITQYAVVRKVNREKLFAHAIEAAEQCERLDVPEIADAVDVRALLGAWPKGRTLLYGDESGKGAALPHLLKPGLGPTCVLIGPEGGFSPDEHRLLAAQPFVKGFSLGPRILKADTAAVAALACVQAQLGDWEQQPHFIASA